MLEDSDAEPQLSRELKLWSRRELEKVVVAVVGAGFRAPDSRLTNAPSKENSAGEVVVRPPP